MGGTLGRDARVHQRTLCREGHGIRQIHLRLTITPKVQDGILTGTQSLLSMLSRGSDCRRRLGTHPKVSTEEEGGRSHYGKVQGAQSFLWQGGEGDEGPMA